MTGDGTGHDPDDIARHVREVIAGALELDVDEVTMESSLFDLGAESLDLLDMAFALEKDYCIQFPQNDLLSRANDHFGPDSLVVRGEVTDLGLRLLRLGMPELEAEVVKPGLRDIDVAQMIQVGSFVRITQRLIEAKDAISRICPTCGGTLEESTVLPELVCTACDEIVPVPSGDDILLEDLIALHAALEGEESGT